MDNLQSNDAESAIGLPKVSKLDIELGLLYKKTMPPIPRGNSLYALAKSYEYQGDVVQAFRQYLLCIASN